MKSVANGSGRVGFGVLMIAVAAACSVVACSEDTGADDPSSAVVRSDAGTVTVPVSTTPPSRDAGVLGVPHGQTPDASAHHAPPPSKGSGPAQTDGGAKPAKDAGTPSSSNGADGSTTTTTTEDDAGDTTGDTTGEDDAGSDDPTNTGSSSSAECATGADCFSVPCGCADGTTEYWQACGASGECLGYGVCLYDQICAAHGGLGDPTAPPATCDDSDPSDCAPVACNCNDGTVLDYQACNGTTCATTASCGVDGDDVCSARGGWVGDAPTPPADPCPDVQCSCADGVTYVVPDELCLYEAVCDTDLVCSGD